MELADYQLARLKWVSKADREAKRSLNGEGTEYQAKTPLYLYIVWENLYGQWLCEILSAVIAPDGSTTYTAKHSTPQKCDSLEGGKDGCEAHWLGVLLESGLIERASNPLLEDIKKTALMVAPDHPNIETVSPHEQLWAIQGSYIGLESANEDLWQSIVRLEAMTNPY